MMYKKAQISAPEAKQTPQPMALPCDSQLQTAEAWGLAAPQSLCPAPWLGNSPQDRNSEGDLNPQGPWGVEITQERMLRPFVFGYHQEIIPRTCQGNLSWELNNQEVGEGAGKREDLAH